MKNGVIRVHHLYTLQSKRVTYYSSDISLLGIIIIIIVIVDKFYLLILLIWNGGSNQF